MHKEKAFTFLELLVVLGLSTTLLLCAIPIYQNFIARNSLSTVANSLISILNFSRTLAVTQQTVITLCASADGLHCGKDWNQGMLVMQDEKRIRVFSPFSTMGKLEWNRNENTIQFSPNGEIKGQNGTFHYCTKETASVRCIDIILSLTGRARIVRNGN